MTASACTAHRRFAVARCSLLPFLPDRQVSCLWCGQLLRSSPAGRPIRTRDWGGDDTVYTYVPCGHCRSLVLINPPPEALMGQHYRDDYGPYQQPLATSLAPLRLPDREALTARATPRQPLQILDYGPGSGAWLACARLTFPDIAMAAVDFDIAASAQRLAWLQQPVTLLNPVDFLASRHSWDLINFSHSLEHITNPLQVLQWAIEHLNPGGLLVVDAPSVDSLSLRVWGPFWQGLEAPRHLSIPAANQVERLLRLQRLRLRQRFTYGSAELFRRTLQQAAQSPCPRLRRYLIRAGRAVCGDGLLNRCCGRLGLATAFRLIASKPPSCR